jgi:hypothetical protein
MSSSAPTNTSSSAAANTSSSDPLEEDLLTRGDVFYTAHPNALKSPLGTGELQKYKDVILRMSKEVQYWMPDSHQHDADKPLSFLTQESAALSEEDKAYRSMVSMSIPTVFVNPIYPFQIMDRNFPLVGVVFATQGIRLDQSGELDWKYLMVSSHFSEETSSATTSSRLREYYQESTPEETESSAEMTHSPFLSFEQVVETFQTNPEKILKTYTPVGVWSNSNLFWNHSLFKHRLGRIVYPFLTCWQNTCGSLSTQSVLSSFPPSKSAIESWVVIPSGLNGDTWLSILHNDPSCMEAVGNLVLDVYQKWFEAQRNSDLYTPAVQNALANTYFFDFQTLSLDPLRVEALERAVNDLFSKPIKVYHQARRPSSLDLYSRVLKQYVLDWTR